MLIENKDLKKFCLDFLYEFYYRVEESNSFYDFICDKDLVKVKVADLFIYRNDYDLVKTGNFSFTKDDLENNFNQFLFVIRTIPYYSLAYEYIGYMTNEVILIQDMVKSRKSKYKKLSILRVLTQINKFKVIFR